MKKRSLVAIVVFLTCFPLGAQAGQNPSATHNQAADARKASGKATSMPGKVGSEGRTFTADKDSRIWMVSNPEALSGVSVTAIPEQRAGIKFDDAAFRR
jgi:hypothetical protein